MASAWNKELKSPWTSKRNFEDNPMTHKDARIKRLNTINARYPNWGDFNKGKFKNDRTIKILCACGCGLFRSKFDKKGRERKYLQGHQTKNKHLPLALREKLSVIKKDLMGSGKIISPFTRPEVIEKCRIANRGKKRSIENRLNLRNKMIRLGIRPPSRKGLPPHNKDRNKENYEPCRKNSEFMKKYCINHPEMTESKILKLIEARKYLVIPRNDTKIEIKIQNFLKELGINFFTHQYIKEIEHGYQCDILIPSSKTIIECDGDYWHKYPMGRDIDHIRTSELLQKGFKVLRLWEFEIKAMDLSKFSAIIASLKEEPKERLL